MNDLIVVKQLPVIEERLRQIKEDIVVKIKNALSLDCTENTVKTIKALRADLAKDFKTLEDKRKSVKTAIMTPYDKFEAIYRDCVTNIFKQADDELKVKINNVEDGLRQRKQNEVIAYFEEYLQSKNIDFVTFENSGINVTLSATSKSLKEQAKTFIDRICDDLALIDTQEYKDEILVDYKKTLNASAAITSVTARHRAIEAEKARQKAAAQIRMEETAVVEKVEAVLSAAVEVETLAQYESDEQAVQNIPLISSNKILKTTFTVYGTKDMLTALKRFLMDGGYKYE